MYRVSVYPTVVYKAFVIDHIFSFCKANQPYVFAFTHVKTMQLAALN